MDASSARARPKYAPRSRADISIIGSTPPPPATVTPKKDQQLDVRAEIFLASLTIALIVASYGHGLTVASARGCWWNRGVPPAPSGAASPPVPDSAGA